jgi:hypothetical protein
MQRQSRSGLGFLTWHNVAALLGQCNRTEVDCFDRIKRRGHWNSRRTIPANPPAEQEAIEGGGDPRAKRAGRVARSRMPSQGHGEYENAQPPPGPPGADKLSTAQIPPFAGKTYR